MNFNNGSQRDDDVYPVWLEAAVIANRPALVRLPAWLTRLLKALLNRIGG